MQFFVGSIACIERYLDQQNSASEFGATLLARAFFEVTFPAQVQT